LNTQLPESGNATRQKEFIIREEGPRKAPVSIYDGTNLQDVIKSENDEIETQKNTIIIPGLKTSLDTRIITNPTMPGLPRIVGFFGPTIPQEEERTEPIANEGTTSGIPENSAGDSSLVVEMEKADVGGVHVKVSALRVRCAFFVHIRVRCAFFVHIRVPCAFLAFLVHMRVRRESLYS